MPGWWNPNTNAYSDHHTTSVSYANGDGNRNHHTTAISYAHSDGDNQANANSKAAAYAISSSDAVSEWAKRSKQLQSK